MSATRRSPAERPHPAESTEFKTVDPKAAALYVKALRVPWKRALLLLMSSEMSFRQLYKRLGWTRGTVQGRERQPDLRLGDLVEIADAAEIPRHRYLSMVLKVMILQRHLPPEPADKAWRPPAGLVWRNTDPRP